MSSGTSQQFCVRWNSHLGSLGAAFPQLLAGQRFVDVTLACEGHQLHCHRLVLAACSTYFESLLGENPCKHPIIILPRDIKLWEIQALVDFMYKGEVNVSQAGLSDLLKCAEILQIRGLCGSEAALNLNQVNAGSAQSGNTSASLNFAHSSVPSNVVASNLPSGTPTASTSQHNTEPRSTSPPSIQQQQQQQSANRDQLEISSPFNTNPTKNCTDTMFNPCPGNGNKRSSSGHDNSLLMKNIKHERFKANESQVKEQRHRTSTPNRVVDKVEPVDISMDEDIDDTDLSNTNDKSLDGETYSSKYADYLESAKGANQHHLTQTQQQLQSENEANLSSTHPSSSLPAVSRSALSITNITLDDYSGTNCDFNSHGAENDENHSFYNEEGGDIYIIKDVDDESNEEICIVEQDQLKSTQRRTKHDPSSTSRLSIISNKNSGLAVGSESATTLRRNNCGKIRVKSNENLFGNYGDVRKPKTKLKKHETYVQRANRNDKYEADHNKSTTLLPIRNSKRSLPGALRFNRNSMTVFLKPAKECPTQNYKDDHEQSEEMREKDYESTPIKTEYETVDNYESIVCLPNVMEMYNDSEEVELSVGEDIVGMNSNASHLDIHNKYDSGVPSDANSVYDDIKVGNEMIYAQAINSSTGLLHYGGTETNSSDQEVSYHYNGLELCGTNGRPVEFAMAQFLSNHVIGDADNNGVGSRGDLIMPGRPGLPSNNNGRRCRYINSNRLNIKVPDRPPADIEPTLSAVVLRNPRSNQPRTYSNDALYAALMDVKAGESIYRASQIHKVPRKTLRNWMKRWHIKSAYPMPRQLKQAAEKKKRIQQLEKAVVTNDSNIKTNAIAKTDFSNFNSRTEKTGNGHSHSSAVMLQSSHRQSHNLSKNLNKK